MGLAAFNRMRREQAELEAAEKAKLEQENKDGAIVPKNEKEPQEPKEKPKKKTKGGK